MTESTDAPTAGGLPADLVGIGIDALIDNARRLGLTWTLRMATVATLSTGNTSSSSSTFGSVTAIYDGDSAPIGMTSVIGLVKPGQRVYCIGVPPSGNFIIGTVGGVAIRKGIIGTTSMGAGAQSSTSYATMAAPNSITYEKVKGPELSNLEVVMGGTFFVTSLACGGEFGVLIGGADYTIAKLGHTNSALNNHTTYWGVATIPDLAAGTYEIFTRWRVSGGGAGTINTDSNDSLGLVIQEVST